MHSHEDLDLNLKNISKIEGHTHLDIKVRKGKVKECKLKVSENKRFFTQAVLGLSYEQVPTTMSRICGTCSSAHVLCSIEAIEKAFRLKVSQQTINLRKLLAFGSHLRDHAMHLYFFCLPDLLKKDSVLDFNEEEKEWIHDGLHLKEIGNELTTLIGGRAVHPSNPTIGGFLNFPEAKEIKKIIDKLSLERKRVFKIIEIFFKDKSVFKRKTNYVGLVSKDFNFIEGFIKTAKGTKIPEENYGDYLNRVVLPYSTATAFKWESKDYMVGALARLNLNKENLHPHTKRDCEKFIKIFPSNFISHNNTAQAIEMVHEIDSSIDLLKKLEKSIKKETPLKPKVKKGTGIGVVEAPRGTLYYHLDINEKGIITFANLCIPTQQNIIHMQKTISLYVESLINKGKNKSEIRFEVEKMIRAYDPCMSCATHFLKINWI